jgi:glycine/D-amino acid oxidase-like deaminating enzyme
LKTDFLIVGQGLAGTVLAHTLIERGKSVIAIDNHHQQCASMVAAGLFNPFVFKWITKSWNADELMKAVHHTYPAIEAATGSHFFHPTGMMRIIGSANERKQWEKKMQRPEFAAQAELFNPEPHQNPGIPAEKGFGKVLIKKAGWVNLPEMVAAYRRKLETEKRLVTERFVHSNLTYEGTWKYGEIEAAHVVFCEGASVDQNPWFGHLAYRHTKGEVLDISSEEIPQDQCLNYGQFIVPLGQQRFRTGTTYNWDQLDWEPTEKARNKILRNHTEYFEDQPEIVGHKAGIRPTSADRRPFAGRHPEHPGLCLLNATGSKGVLLAPWTAGQLVNHLLDGTPLHPEIDLNRTIAAVQDWKETQ